MVIIIIVLSAVLTVFEIGRPLIFLKDAKGGAAAPPHPLNPPLAVTRSSLASRRSVSGRRVCAAIAKTESRPTVRDLTASVCNVVPVCACVAWRRYTQSRSRAGSVRLRTRQVTLRRGAYPVGTVLFDASNHEAKCEVIFPGGLTNRT